MSQANSPEEWQKLDETDHAAEDPAAEEDEDTSTLWEQFLFPKKHSLPRDAPRFRYGFMFCLSLLVAVTLTLSAMAQMFYSLVAYQLSGNTSGVRVALGVLITPLAYVEMSFFVQELIILTLDALAARPLLRFRVMLLAIGVPVLFVELFILVVLDVVPVIGGISGALKDGHESMYVAMRQLFYGYADTCILMVNIFCLVFIVVHCRLSFCGTEDQMLHRIHQSMATFKDKARTHAATKTVGAVEGFFEEAEEEVRELTQKWRAHFKRASSKKTVLLLVAALALLLVLSVFYGLAWLPFYILLTGLTVAMIIMVCAVSSAWPEGTGCSGVCMAILFILFAIMVQGFAASLAQISNSEIEAHRHFFDQNFPPPNFTFTELPATYYPVCRMRWGSPDVATRELTLSATDLALFASVVYELEDVGRKVEAEFFGTPLGPPKLEHLMPREVVGRWGVWLFPKAKLRVFAIRGTQLPLDIIADGEIWGTIGVMQIFGHLMPLFKILSDRTTLRLMKIWSNPLGLFGDNHFWDPVIGNATEMKKKSDEEGVTMVITGHSLGGALAMAAGAHSGAQSVVFSPPGMRFAMGKMNIHGWQIRKTTTAIVPDWDMVPWVDEQKGFTQYIDCPLAPMYCHGMRRTACELYSRCGDAFGRNSSCSRFEP